MESEKGGAPHLSIFVIDEYVPGAVVLQVGDLQAVGGADFRRLEGGVQGVYLHYGFGLSGLERKHLEGIYRGAEDQMKSEKNELERDGNFIFTSCLLKYFNTPSRSERMNFRLRYCPLSLPRFHRNPSR